MAAGFGVRPDLRLGSRWLLVGGFVLLTVMLVSLIPIHREPSSEFTYLDKVAHFIVFIGLMLFFNGFMQPRLRLQVALLLLCCGILIELLQIPVPGRSAELADFWADALGIAIGWLLAASERFNWCHWLEAATARNG